MRLAVLIATFALGAGCAPGPTRLVALVDTDLGVPDEIAALRVRSLRADADVEEEFSSVVLPLSEDTARPVAVAITPHDPMDIGRVMIEAEGQSAMGLRVVARRAVTEFRVGEQLAVPLFLHARCRRVICPMGQTCGEMGCESMEVAVEELAPYEGELAAP